MSTIVRLLGKVGECVFLLGVLIVYTLVVVPLVVVIWVFLGVALLFGFLAVSTRQMLQEFQKIIDPIFEYGGR